MLDPLTLLSWLACAFWVVLVFDRRRWWPRDHRLETDSVVAGIRKALMSRHAGEEDFTIVTQTEMLDVLGRVPMDMSKPPAPVETYKMTLSSTGPTAGKLQLEFENVVASVPFTVK